MAEERTCVFQFQTVSVYSDGTVSRAPYDPPPIPASPLGDGAPALTRDLTLNAVHGTWIRLYLPRPPPAGTDNEEHAELTKPPKRKLPILLYFHGGGFVQGTTSVPIDHRFLCTLASQASTLIVSVDYRLAPEHRLPCAYEDCIDALLWLRDQGKVSREGAEGSAADPWLSSHGDFSRVFLAGDSAGGNIAHHVAVRAASAELGLMEGGLCVRGCIPIHPFFGSEALTDLESQNPGFVNYVRKLWRQSLPDGEASSMDHPYANPMASPSFLEDIAALPPVLVTVAGADLLRDRGTAYFDALQKAGKQAKLLMSADEPHVFHLHNPASQNFPAFVQELATFLNS